MPPVTLPKITLHPIAEADLAEFQAFETDNRAHFELEIGGLGDAYYTPEGVAEGLAKRAAAWAEDTAFHYLVRNEAGELVGHIQLFNVQRGPRQRAELGYRIAARHGGRGYATAAARQAVAAAFGVHGLHRLEGVTSLTNLASQAVLLKNGFTFWGRAHSCYLLNGVWEDSLFFERLAPEG